MLSYRHAFHAGGAADVLKHIVLLACLDYLKQKEKGFFVLDTHAGAGTYRLDQGYAQKRKEYEQGVAKLWTRDYQPRAQLISAYLDVLRQMQSGARLLTYPGSPALVAQAIRDQDRARFCELHPTDFNQLEQSFTKRRRIKVANEDGWQAMRALLPPPQRRGLVLIDPSYEIKSDYQKASEALIAAHRRFATGTYLLWYPVVKRYQTEAMIQALVDANIGNMLRVELQHTTKGTGMQSSGLVLINPPYNLSKKLQAAMPELVKHMGQSKYVLKQLAHADG